MHTITVSNQSASFVRVVDVWGSKADARYTRRQLKKQYPFKSYTFKGSW